MGKRQTLAICSLLLFTFLSAALGPPCLAKKKPPLHPINLNTASSTELQEVPGIGPVTADKILKMRKSYGPFKSVDDLRAIKGIGPKRLEKMRKYLTVANPPAKKTSQSSTNKTKTTPTSPDNKPQDPEPKPE